MPKKREPIPRVFMVDGEVYEESVVPPSWQNRSLVADSDVRHGLGGRAVEALERHFGNDWLQQQRDAAHPVARMMYWQHELYVRQLLDVADLLVCAEDQALDMREMGNRLRSVEEYESAEMELRVARLLRLWNQTVRTVPRTQNRTHDFDCIEGHVAVEVKRLEPAERSDFEVTLTNMVMDRVVDHVGFDVAFWWEGERVEVAWKGSESRQALMHAISVDVVPQLASALREGRAEVVVPDTVLIRIQPSGDPEIGRFGPFGDDVRAANRTRKRWEKALRQLPDDRPALVFLCGDYHTIAVDETRRAALEWMEQAGSAAAHVAGIVLLLVRGGRVRTIEEIWPLRNPSAADSHALWDWSWLNTPVGWLR